MDQTSSDLAVRDDLAIRSLIARIALLGDVAHPGDQDDYIALFDEDFKWSVPGASGGGHDGIRDTLASGAEGRDSNTRHIITTQSVATDGGDTATSDSAFMLYGDASTAPKLLMLGVYHDTVRRTDSGWKLLHRDVTFG